MPQEDPTHINKVFEQSGERIRIDGAVSQHLIGINRHDTHVAIDQIIAIMNNFGIHKLRIIPMQKEDKANPEIGGVSSDGAATLTRIASVSKSKAHKSKINDNEVKSPFLEDLCVDLVLEVDLDALNDAFSIADVLMMRGIDNSIQLSQTLDHLNGILRRGLLEGGFKHNFRFPYQLDSNLQPKHAAEMYVLSHSVLYSPILYSVGVLLTRNTNDIVPFIPSAILAYFMVHFGHFVRSGSAQVSRHDIFPGLYPFMNVLLGTIRTLNLDGFTAMPHTNEQES